VITVVDVVQKNGKKVKSIIIILPLNKTHTKLIKLEVIT